MAIGNARMLSDITLLLVQDLKIAFILFIPSIFEFVLSVVLWKPTACVQLFELFGGHGIRGGVKKGVVLGGAHHKVAYTFFLYQANEQPFINHICLIVHIHMYLIQIKPMNNSATQFPSAKRPLPIIVWFTWNCKYICLSTYIYYEREYESWTSPKYLYKPYAHCASYQRINCCVVHLIV